ncbi:hypothetical protein N9A08_12825 [Arthrobacter koreensis]|uniref:Capsid maturation protease n=1 Tax=Arthrobacter koreensis TaxID=199136 RepID=A0ABY6FQK3_9MICC|nr:hypothetical protein [Arthrobacter koreensis]UYB35500.1 hypothetical protein N9A08_12825 [Arthrobacter koreensis]
MIPYSAVSSYSLTLDQLSVAALADLRGLLDGLQGTSPERTQMVLHEAFPEVFDPFVSATSAVSASFYEEVRDMSGVKGSFAAQTLDSVETDRWRSLVGFGTAPAVFEQGGAALMYSLLSGGLTKVLTEMAADTVIGNAGLDPAPMAYQRVPQPGCCAFCGMLASRGAAYSSQEAATGVVGRGVPVGKGRGKGSKGRGGGIKPRGARKVGETFHDHCRCRAVPVSPGNSVEMQADADKYFASYATARDRVNAGLELRSTTYEAPDGSLKNKYEWVDSTGVVSAAQKTKNIVAGMRHDLGVK